MKIYVKHHNWRWNKKQGWWSGDTIKTFNSKSAFDKYVSRIKEKYPHNEITYFIYEYLDGVKGDILAHLSYNGIQFEGARINPKWEEFCNQ